MQSEFVWVLKKLDIWIKIQYSDNAQLFQTEHHLQLHNTAIIMKTRLSMLFRLWRLSRKYHNLYVLTERIGSCTEMYTSWGQRCAAYSRALT